MSELRLHRGDRVRHDNAQNNRRHGLGTVIVSPSRDDGWARVSWDDGSVGWNMAIHLIVVEPSGEGGAS